MASREDRAESTNRSQELPAVRTESSSLQTARAVATVLVVDDDRSFRASVRRLLSAEGYSATDAEPDSALQALSDGWDVVLADLKMPGIDGIELLRRVRSKDRHTSVVLVTGEPSVATAAEAVELGAFAYLIKPVDSTRLLDVVGRAARMSRMVRLQQLGSQVGRTSASLRAAHDSNAHARLDRAVETLWLAHQPIVDTRSRATVGYELLMRQGEPSLPHPGAVLELGERLGRMQDIGRAVRRAAARCAAALPNDTLVFVNLHTSDLADPDLVNPGAPLTRFADRTVLEVTERASLQGIPNPVETCGQLRKLGYRLAVDDLGAGYSGLSSLPLLEPEFVKIDMSLVRAIDSEKPKQRIVAGLVSLAHELAMNVVSEGVETELEKETLMDLGSDFLQGYLLGRPERRCAAG